MASWKLIQKARQILEREKGTVRKSWGGKFSICLIYPNSYHVGMSNLGFQTLYHLLNLEEDIACERAFFPAREDLEEHRQTRTPLFSLESQKPLSEFDILAFSISFENDFLNVLSILDLGHIPIESRHRGKGNPLVIAGGVSVFLNPEPLAPFFDLFILGEAEEVIGEFLEAYRLHFAAETKDRFLEKVAEVEGVYIPKYYEVTYQEDGRIEAMNPKPGYPPKVKRRWVRELDRFLTRSTLFTPDTEFKGTVLVEVNRGCPRGCRFCAACFVYHPYRNRSLSALESVSEEGLAKERRIGLTGTAVSDYSQLVPLCQRIVSMRGGIALASLRVDAIDESLAECLKEGDIHSVSIAPEAGTERLRKLLRKGYSEEEILYAVDQLVERGVLQIKCYFLIGLPSETDEDVKAILDLAKQIRHHILSKQKGEKGRGNIVLSINPFIPKPATPFQWLPLEEVDELKRKLKMIQRGLKGERGIEMIHDLPKWAYLQTLLSKGDRKVGKILMAAHQLQGDWSRALRETNFNPDFYVHRWRNLDEIFPWDFIDHGISKEALRKEYMKAMEEAGIRI
ncbi:MAG: TIGR03960 family B12-binding radical SAM protein [Thermodesulfobacteriota bacterium]